MHLLDQAVAAAQDDRRGYPAFQLQVKAAYRIAFALEDFAAPAHHRALAKRAEQFDFGAGEIGERAVTVDRIRHIRHIRQVCRPLRWRSS